MNESRKWQQEKGDADFDVIKKKVLEYCLSARFPATANSIARRCKISDVGVVKRALMKLCAEGRMERTKNLRFVKTDQAVPRGEGWALSLNN